MTLAEDLHLMVAPRSDALSGSVRVRSAQLITLRRHSIKRVLKSRSVLRVAAAVSRCDSSRPQQHAKACEPRRNQCILRWPQQPLRPSPPAPKLRRCSRPVSRGARTRPRRAVVRTSPGNRADPEPRQTSTPSNWYLTGFIVPPDAAASEASNDLDETPDRAGTAKESSYEGRSSRRVWLCPPQLCAADLWTVRVRDFVEVIRVRYAFRGQGRLSVCLATVEHSPDRCAFCFRAYLFVAIPLSPIACPESVKRRTRAVRSLYRAPDAISVSLRMCLDVRSCLSGPIDLASHGRLTLGRTLAQFPHEGSPCRRFA